MRRTFLAALLVAVCAAVVLAPSAMTKKTPPPVSGAFTLSPMSAIALTNMTLVSDDQVAVYALIWTSTSGSPDLRLLGVSSGPGETVQLADWGYVNEYTFPVQVRLALLDNTAAGLVGYLSDGTLNTAGGTQAVSHVTLGWVKDQTVISINDGSQNTLTDWEPVLGAGNFNATFQLGSLLPTSTGVTITNITGYSDGANSDESGNPVCGFHAEFTYTADKAKTVQGATATMLLLGGNVNNMLGGSTASLDASPFNPGAFYVPANPSPGSDYAFLAVIEGSNSDTLAIQFGSTFTLDPSTYVNGCPPVGELVSTNSGE